LRPSLAVQYLLNSLILPSAIDQKTPHIDNSRVKSEYNRKTNRFLVTIVICIKGLPEHLDF